LGMMFQYEFHARDEALDATVPRVLLQSVVESVLGSAVGPLVQPACVSLTAERVQNQLRLSVEGGGPGLATHERWGFTTRPMKTRLLELRSTEPSLRWTKLQDETVRVEMEMPFATAGIL